MAKFYKLFFILLIISCNLNIDATKKLDSTTDIKLYKKMNELLNSGLYNENQIINILDLINDLPFSVPIRNLNSKILFKYGLFANPEYKCIDMNTNIILSGKKGDEIISTADGIVREIIEFEKIEDNKKVNYFDKKNIVIEKENFNNYKYKSYGYTILIEHKYGFCTRYTNLELIKVKVGETIKKGQVIGILGENKKTKISYLNYLIIVGYSTYLDPESYLLLK